MLYKKNFYLILSLLSATVIVGRALFYFKNALLLMAILETVFFLMFIFLMLIEKRSIYFAIFSFISTISFYYLVTGQLIYDLTPLAILLTIYLFLYLRKLKIKPILPSIKIILLTYFIITILGSIGLFYNLNMKMDVKESLNIFKYIIFLGQTLYCAYIFSLIYKREDKTVLKIAIFTAITSYFIASSLGYFFPSGLLAEKEELEFLYKVLFRYPGLSTSNFIAHILLLMTAIHMNLNSRKNLLFYTGFIALIFISSQSRSIVLPSIILLTFQIASKKDKIQVIKESKDKKKIFFKTFVFLFVTLLALTIFRDYTKSLSLQSLERLKGNIAFQNITARLSLIQNAYLESTENLAFWLFGHGYIHRDNNPHNLFFSSLLIFGWPATMFVLIMFVILLIKIPKTLFIFIAAQFEILFFTSIYDFLFIIFILTYTISRCSNENRHR